MHGAYIDFQIEVQILLECEFVGLNKTKDFNTNISLCATHLPLNNYKYYYYYYYFYSHSQFIHSEDNR